MRKISFFLNNANLIGVDCRNIEKGNPGIGGSEFVIISVAHYLSLHKDKLNVTVFAPNIALLPKSLQTAQANNMSEAISIAEKEGIETLSFRHDRAWIVDGSLKSATKVKLISWCHNFITYRDVKFYEQCPQLVHIVHVGKEQMELYLDTDLYDKMDYIYNGMSMEVYHKLKNSMTPFSQRENIVTYMGSIVPNKGLHVIAKAWTDILKAVPDAQLYIIGGGKLYNRNAVMGKYGIATEPYESSFMRYLTDENGEILPSVHFMGVMGAEKNDILLKTKIGVPNPCGRTETFGITAVEMQLLGAKVVTKLCPGYADTVFEKKCLYLNDSDCAKYVANALKSDSYAFDEAFDFCEQSFSYNKIIAEWIKFYVDGYYEKPKGLHHKANYQNLALANKRCRILNAKLRKVFPFLPPFIYWEECFLSKIKNKFSK